MPHMEASLRLFAVVHVVMAVLFAAAAIMLTVMSSHMAWEAFAGGLDKDAAQQV